MKIHTCIQGSTEWLKLRCGIPTASRFGELVTPLGKARDSEGRKSYARELAYELMTGRAFSREVTPAMERGTLLESAAREWYAFASGKSVSQVGFISDDAVTCGASPDGITDCGGVEIKCPGLGAYLCMLDTRDIGGDYYLQVQGCMWISSRATWDFCLYTDAPGLPSAWWTIQRDERVCAALAVEVPKFAREVAECMHRILR